MGGGGIYFIGGVYFLVSAIYLFLILAAIIPPPFLSAHAKENKQQLFFMEDITFSLCPKQD